MNTRTELKTCSECDEIHEVEVFLIDDEQFDRIIDQYGPVSEYQYVCISCALGYDK